MSDIDSTPTPPAGTPRPPGRARQRIQQRRESQPVRAMPDPTRARSGAQLEPTGRIKLPEIKLPRAQLYPLYIGGAVLFIVLVVFILGRVRNQEVERPPNALWIGTEWTYEVHDDAAIADYVADLRAREIGTVYAWLSWLQADNTWRGADNFDNVQAFVRQFKAAYPESELIAWISFPVDAGSGYRMDQVDLQTQVAEFSQTAVTEFGFDGVFLNIEPVWDDDQNFLAMVRRVRSAIGDEVLLAAAIPPDWSPTNADIPVPPLIVPGTEWNTEYKQTVALLLDQLAIMSYNSGLSSPADYTQWMAYQVRAYAQALDALGVDLDTELLIGIPTYDAELPGHDPAVESVPAAADGIRLGIQQAGESARYVRGAAIYAGWTTDDTEWAQYEGSWLRP
jgi:hypothetical protein